MDARIVNTWSHAGRLKQGDSPSKTPKELRRIARWYGRQGWTRTAKRYRRMAQEAEREQQ